MNWNERERKLTSARESANEACHARASIYSSSSSSPLFLPLPHFFSIPFFPKLGVLVDGCVPPPSSTQTHTHTHFQRERETNKRTVNRVCQFLQQLLQHLSCHKEKGKENEKWKSVSVGNRSFTAADTKYWLLGCILQQKQQQQQKSHIFGVTLFTRSKEVEKLKVSKAEKKKAYLQHKMTIRQLLPSEQQ